MNRKFDVIKLVEQNTCFESKTKVKLQNLEFSKSQNFVSQTRFFLTSFALKKQRLSVSKIKSSVVQFSEDLVCIR